MRDMERPYNLGDCEFHLALKQILSKSAQCPPMRKWDVSVLRIRKWEFTFIEDPDGYWLEILPPKK